MKQLKDVTVNLKGVDLETIERLYQFASTNANEYDLWVTDGGYDLVKDETPLPPTPPLMTSQQFQSEIKAEDYVPRDQFKQSYEKFQADYTQTTDAIRRMSEAANEFIEGLNKRRDQAEDQPSVAYIEPGDVVLSDEQRNIVERSVAGFRPAAKKKRTGELHIPVGEFDGMRLEIVTDRPLKQSTADRLAEDFRKFMQRGPRFV